MSRRITTRQLYGFYDHKHSLAKIGIAQEPLARFSTRAFREHQLELVFSIEVPEPWIRSAEFVAHLAFEGRRMPHPVPNMPGPTEWFDVSREAVGFLKPTLERFIDAACASPNPSSYVYATRLSMQRKIGAARQQKRGAA